MDEMFEVFEDQSSGVEQNQKSSKKRLANGHAEDAGDGMSTPDRKRQKRDSSDDEDGEIDEDVPMPAIPRQDTEPEPIVADSYEIEQSREVQGNAGLQGQKESANVVLSHQVRHQVALPPDYNYIPLAQHKPPEKPAREWPFELDPFQKVAVTSIQRNESVLVSAHTSAGKTVCAEYAIAQCLQNNQRVIYTSPIKALSNQKYREFNAEFGDVGLMTGDVTINPTATCLVMTTEILRSMLYRGSEIMREVGWVVFDEVHYLRDASRGVVWEETIILLPDKVRYVFLSATIPNAMQFAEWIVKTHNQPCHVVYTDFRPTPLQHYLFPQGADGIHLVVDEKGVFREENFAKAMASLAEKQGDDPSNPNAKMKGRGKNKRINKGGEGTNSGIYKIVKMIMVKNYNPVIVFSFSKRECESNALMMSALSFNDDSEKELVGKVFENALDMLTDDDRNLPQIQHILPLLKRGIGVHHSGLLPILKETIEILFQEGLIKVLFATETFSIGLNMPAKTVVFTSVRKFDGKGVRWVTPSEFIQMSGRAGRRGLDERGIVIMMIDEKMEPAVGQEIVRGQQDNLNSAFHLGYNMILNLLRVEGVNPEFMLERCFKQFQSTASVSGMEKELHRLEAERADMEIDDEATIKEYFDLRKNLDSHIADMKAIVTHPNYCLPFMQPGRLIQIKHENHDFGWGVVVNHKPARYPGAKAKPQEQYNVHALVQVAADSSNWRPPVDGEPSKMEIVPMTLDCIQAIGHLRIFLPAKEIRDEASKRQVLLSLNEVKKRFPEGISSLDPVQNMNIDDEHFRKLMRKIEVRETRLLSNPLHNSPRLPALYSQYSQKVELSDKIKKMRRDIQSALSVTQLEELKNRKRVLRRLGFVNDADVVQLKARVACELSTGDELVLSELLFDRFFNELSPEHCAAILSVFVFEEKAEPKEKLRDELAKSLREVHTTARKVAKVSQESKLEIDEEEYVKSFKPELMDVVFAWAKGASFAEIAKMTDVYEGSLIRIFRRLEELLRQMTEAAKVMGSDDLAAKFEETLKMISRDIVSAQSLYL